MELMNNIVVERSHTASEGSVISLTHRF